MSFKVPASKASIGQNRFKFELEVEEKGKTKTLYFDVPKMQYISSDLRFRLQENGAVLKALIDAEEEVSPAHMAAANALQRELFETYAPGLFGKVTDDQLEAVQAAWQEASSITVGESSPSAD